MISPQLNKALARRYGTSEMLTRISEALQVRRAMKALPMSVDVPVRTDCCIVFSDISGFSRRVAGRDSMAIKRFLDDYYAEILPIIHGHGGLVDQMLGDGIIAVYLPNGATWDAPDVFDMGLMGADAIVSRFASNTEYSTKCALHRDRVVLCEVGDATYSQATIVGNALTAVHRVEGVARDRATNMLYSLPEAKSMYEQAAASGSSSVRATWQLGLFAAELPGVSDRPSTILYREYSGR